MENSTEEYFLGNVAWYSLPSNLLVDLSELEKFREEIDPLIKLPKKPSKVNLFKRACKETNWKEDGVRYSFSEEKKTIHGPARNFIEKYRSDGSVFEDVKGRVYLDSNNKLVCEELSEKYLLNWDAACEMLKEKMRLENHVDHMAVRSVIKDVLENKMKAVWLNSGTYFVKSQYSLSALRKIVFCIGGEMEFIPLVNNPQQRSLLHSGYSRMVYAIEAEFSKKLAKLGENPSAFKVEQLKKMIDEVTYLQNEMSKLGFTFTTGQYMEYMLNEKLS